MENKKVVPERRMKFQCGRGIAFGGEHSSLVIGLSVQKTSSSYEKQEPDVVLMKVINSKDKVSQNYGMSIPIGDIPEFIDLLKKVAAGE
jgi:hypothetical protein